MSVAIGLAAALLGARIADTPFAGADRSVPAWVRRHVLNGFGSRPGDHALLPFFALPRQPGRILAALRARWPRDALQVTILNRRPVPPRIPRRLQLQDAASRLAQAVGDDSRRARHER